MKKLRKISKILFNYNENYDLTDLTYSQKS